MFGREFISIILRNLSSIQPALRDVNRNSGRNPYPKISVKTICQRKSASWSGFMVEASGAVLGKGEVADSVWIFEVPSQ